MTHTEKIDAIQQRMEWSMTEDALLLEHYPTATWEELAKMFPTRNKAGITGRAYKIKAVRLKRDIQPRATRYTSAPPGGLQYIAETALDWGTCPKTQRKFEGLADRLRSLYGRPTVITTDENTKQYYLPKKNRSAA